MKISFFSMIGGSSLLNQFVSRESTVTFLLVVRVVKDKFIKSLTIYTGYYPLYSFCFYFIFCVRVVALAVLEPAL